MTRRGAAIGILVAVGLLVAGCSGGDGERADDARPVEAEVPDEVTVRAGELLDGIGPNDPGCAVAVRRGYEVVWTDAAGLADLDTGEPIDGATVFDIGSTSKIFTATLVLDLVATGELALDDTVADHLAGLPAWAERVTVEQLLHHTSGIPDYVDLLYDEGYVDADRTTVQDAYDVLAGVGLEREPGQRFAYTNSGYLLLAEIAGAVTRQSPADAMEERVFARYDLDAELNPVTDDPRRATSYVRTDGGWRDADSAWEQVGDGAVQTTPVELVRWASELWHPRHPAEVSYLRLAGAVPDSEEGGRYGAGVSIRSGPLGRTIGHDGAWAGFISDLIVVPDRELAAAVTCNTPGPVDSTAVAEDLLALFA